MIGPTTSPTNRSIAVQRPPPATWQKFRPHVQFEAIYSTMHDVLVVCSDERDKLREKSRSGEAGVHGSYLKPGMTVMDLSAIEMCEKGRLPILVFNYKKEGNIERAIAGHPIGTLVTE